MKIKTILSFRFLTEDDAQFVIDLRTDPMLSKYISPTSKSLDDQIAWTKKYKQREKTGKELYFICYENGIKKGTVKLYKINNFSFSYGGLIFKNNKHILTPIITDLVIGDYGFRKLGLNIILFDAIKENKHVIKYHSRKNPLCYYEDEKSYYYLLTYEMWKKSRVKLLDFFKIPISNFEIFVNGKEFTIK